MANPVCQNIVLGDRIAGMAIGHALGDSLGFPSEFPIHKPYTGHLVQAERTKRGVSGRRIAALGQVTDDTEMAISLSSALSKRPMVAGIGGRPNVAYSVDAAVNAYISWANSGIEWMGRNTRNHFLGVRNKAGYLRRVTDMQTTGQQVPLGNGCLMRAYPLALVTNWSEAAKIDCALTNRTKECEDCVVLYVQLVKMALDGADKERILAVADAFSTREIAVQKAISDSRIREESARDIKVNRGLAVHALYCALWGLRHFSAYRAAIDAIILHSTVPGKCSLVGDTDTNAAVAGALLGAYYGSYGMQTGDPTGRTASEILVVLNCDTTTGGDYPRPDAYKFSRNYIRRLIALTE